MHALYKSDLNSSSNIWALSEAKVCGHKMHYWHHRMKHRTYQISLRKTIPKSLMYYQANQNYTPPTVEPSTQKQELESTSQCRCQKPRLKTLMLATKESFASSPMPSSSSQWSFQVPDLVR